jgi:hypothetical protein
VLSASLGSILFACIQWLPRFVQEPLAAETTIPAVGTAFEGPEFQPDDISMKSIGGKGFRQRRLRKKKAQFQVVVA